MTFLFLGSFKLFLGSFFKLNPPPPPPQSIFCVLILFIMPHFACTTVSVSQHYMAVQSTVTFQVSLSSKRESEKLTPKNETNGHNNIKQKITTMLRYLQTVT